MNLKKIILYREPAEPGIDIPHLVDFLKNMFPINVEVRDSIFKEFTNDQIKNISKIRVIDPKNPFHRYNSNETEIEFERKLCNNSSIMNTTTKIENAKKN